MARTLSAGAYFCPPDLRSVAPAPDKAVMHRLFTPGGGDAEPLFRIGLAPIPVERWFEDCEADPASRKDALLASHPALVWGETEGSRPAQAEAAAMIADWLSTTLIAAGPPLRAAARLVSDDLCLMKKRPHGDAAEWTLTAASLCAPSRTQTSSQAEPRLRPESARGSRPSPV